MSTPNPRAESQIAIPRTWPEAGAWVPRSARWIGPRPPFPANSYFAFRADLELEEPLASVLLHITASTRYRIWVNGTMVADGPPGSVPSLRFVDRHEIADLLQRGINHIAVLVHHVGLNEVERPALLAEIVGPHGDVIAATGPDWEMNHCTAWKADTFSFRMNWFDPYQEWFDSRMLEEDWTRRANSWPTAPLVVRQPCRVLIERPIPHLTSRPQRARRIARVDECLALEDRIHRGDLSIALSMPGQPLRKAVARDLSQLLAKGNQGFATLSCSRNHLKKRALAEMHDPCVVLDFGRILNGCLEIEVEGPPGAILDVGFAERLIDGWFNNSLEGQFASRCILRGGRQIWRTFSWRAQQFLKVRLRECPSPLKIFRCEVIEERAGLRALGQFHASRDIFNDIFAMCRRTLEICTHEQFMDTPWREQGQWIGDVAGVTAGGIRWCTGDNSYVKTWLLAAAHQQASSGLLPNITNALAPSRGWIDKRIPSFSLWWIFALEDYWLYTGDRATLEHLMPAAYQVLSCFERAADKEGMVGEMEGWNFVDWAPVDLQGKSATINALYARALWVTSTLAEELGHRQAAKKLVSRRAKLIPVFRRLFWRADGCVVDGIAGGKRSSVVSEHANAAAIWAGLLAPVQVSRVIRNIFEQRIISSVETQPFFTRVVLEVLADQKRWDLAEGVLHERWGERFVKRGYRTTPEEWSAHGTWRQGGFEGCLRSLSHAWSAFPAEFLLTRLAGLRILEAGCRRIRLQPRKTSWDYQLSLPLPQGELRLKKKGEHYHWTAPVGVKVDWEEPI